MSSDRWRFGANSPLVQTQGQHVRDSNWYYGYKGEQRGPMSWEQLRVVASMGGIDPDTLVWTDGYSNWRPAIDVPDLLDVESHPPVPMEKPRSPTTAAEPRNVPRSAADIVLGGICGVAAAITALIALLLILASFGNSSMLPGSLVFVAAALVLGSMARRMLRTDQTKAPRGKQQ